MERPYRTFRRIRCGWLAALLVAAPLAAQVHLTHLGTYATGSYDAAAAEVATYHAGAQRIYFTNADANTVVALNAANPAQPAALFTIDMSPYGAGVNSVTALADGIAVAVEAAPKTDPGAVVFFDVDGNFLAQVTVGALPDMVTVTPDGTKVLVANEGEPSDDYTIDPVGSVSIIDITGGTAALTQAQVVTLDFSGYTSDMLPGVRLFGPGATVAQDMEPEHIAVSPDSQKAFVVCQENNAVARIDLATLTIEHVAALGMKDHDLPGNGLDASNQDNAINIANWPVKGYYMPDGMRAYAVGGQTYVVYANEGDAREWGDFIEPVRIGHASYQLDPAVFPDAETLKQNNNLGRLNATRHGGDINGDGLYEEIHVFGARSFSIRDADGALVYDSGDDFEQITAMAFPADFNSNNDENDSFDSRSDDKGPEPEAIELAEIDGRHYAFIGLERIGGIMVYDITDPAAPTFVQYVNNRDFSGDAEAGSAGDLGVEDITFVSATDSPDGEAFIITANETSGTVSIFRVGPPPPPAQLAVWTYEPVQGTTAAPLANIGTGTSALVGSMTGATTATGSTTGCAQAGGTVAWQIGTANPGTADQSSGVEYRTSTAGHADITFSYDHRISNSGTRTARVQYTLDGTDWTDMELDPDNYTSGCAARGGLDLGRIDASDPVGNNVSDSWGRRTIDFSAIEGANDNPDFGVRILAAHYANTGQFRQANNVNNVATAGTWRLDNVTFAGQAMEPPVGDCTNDLTIEFVIDANGTDIAWCIEPLAGGSPLCGGAGLPSNAVVTAECCLPDGCYRLVVTDAGGDGITGGGYVLRTAYGERIIDNTGNFSTGSVSSVADGFCLPLGDDRPISTSCDRTWWQSGNYLVAAGNPAVSAQFGVSNTTSGYEFWFYDPNGGLSFRKFRDHATSDGFAPNNAMRAAHIKLNNWAAANHLQDNVLYNVRIRGVVDGTELPYGPACRVVFDPVAAACTPTGLNDIAGHPNFSCGVSRAWGGPNSAANRLHARSVGGANKYQFEFSNADEAYLAVVQSNTVIRHLNWSSQPPLSVGSIYQVRVRASKDGGATWCNWGWTCEVTVAPGVAQEGESFAALGQNGVSLWPNPNNGQQLWMEIDGLTDDVRTIAVDIHDLSGKRVIAREVRAQHGTLILDLNSGLAAGTYVVAITAGDQRFVERLVITD